MRRACLRVQPSAPGRRAPCRTQGHDGKSELPRVGPNQRACVVVQASPLAGCSAGLRRAENRRLPACGVVWGAQASRVPRTASRRRVPPVLRCSEGRWRTAALPDATGVADSPGASLPRHSNVSVAGPHGAQHRKLLQRGFPMRQALCGAKPPACDPATWKVAATDAGRIARTTTVQMWCRPSACGGGARASVCSSATCKVAGSDTSRMHAPLRRLEAVGCEMLCSTRQPPFDNRRAKRDAHP